jgi:ubiquitin-protein ligase E3 A
VSFRGALEHEQIPLPPVKLTPRDPMLLELRFTFMETPYLLDPTTKGEYLKVESMMLMRYELQDAFFRAIFIGVNSPYLDLEVRREFIIEDSVAQVSLIYVHRL